jgi:hypothetical protein
MAERQRECVREMEKETSQNTILNDHGESSSCVGSSDSHVRRMLETEVDVKFQKMRVMASRVNSKRTDDAMRDVFARIQTNNFRDVKAASGTHDYKANRKIAGALLM